jgi:hypothetical protein
MYSNVHNVGLSNAKKKKIPNWGGALQCKGANVPLQSHAENQLPLYP